MIIKQEIIMKQVSVIITVLFLSINGVFAQTRQYVEIRCYISSSEEKRNTLMTVLDKAFIPALSRLGIKKAGIYAGNADMNGGNKEYNTKLFAILVHPSLESFATYENKLLADTTYLKGADAIFSAPMKSPLYDSCQSSLLVTFKACPDVVQTAKSADRIMQLRIYNSYNIERNAKKISMFEEGGELKLFRNAGMYPVFFGHAVSGDKLPNLTYMLSFESMEEKEKAWGKFVKSEGWKTLKAQPQYKDTANKITNIILKPSANSQL